MTLYDELKPFARGDFGELLNEPYRDQGCHQGMLIGLEEVKSDDDTFLIFNGRIATKQG